MRRLLPAADRPPLVVVLSLLLVVLSALAAGFGTARAETDAQRAAHYGLWAHRHGLEGVRAAPPAPRSDLAARLGG